MNKQNKWPLLSFLSILSLLFFFLVFLNIQFQDNTFLEPTTWILAIVAATVMILLAKPIPVVDNDQTKAIGLDFYLNLIVMLVGGYYVLLIAALISTTYNIIRQAKKGFIHRSVITFLSIMISIHAMSLVYFFLGGKLATELTVISIFPLLISGAINFISNGFLLAAGITVEAGQKIPFFKQVYGNAFRWAYRYLLWDAIYSFLTAFAVISLLNYSQEVLHTRPLSVALLILVLGAILYYPMKERIHSFQINVQYNKQNIDLMKLNEDLTQLNEQLEKTNDIAVKAFLASLKGKDSYTEGHSVRVSNYGVALAKELGYSEKQLRTIEMAGFLHDIGKIKINENILNKPDRLTNEEYAEIKRHPLYGLEILQDMYQKSDLQNEDYQMMANITAMHHERFDGKGYPYGLKGEDIPFEARILAVVDTFDAMTTTRSYRKGLTIEQAREEIINNLGTQFCPVAGAKFVECIDNGKIKLL